jgi:hypothetical protein
MSLVTHESSNAATLSGFRAWWSRWFALDHPLNKGDAEHERRALQLLKANLSPEQRKEYEEYASFDVIGGVTGRRYRICHGDQLNVRVLGKGGRSLTALCFTPRGHLPIGDVMLAQKIALELFELEVLQVANRNWPQVPF